MAKITEYLETVGDQIRWKRARQPLLRELETHLLEQQEYCALDGAEDAETEAVRQMGDPVLLGQELDRIHRPKPQWKLLLLVGLLSLLGAWLRVYTGTHVLRVGLYLAVGFTALFGMYLLDFTFLTRHARVIYWGTILLSIFSLFYSPMLNGVYYYTRYLVLLYPLVYALFVTTLRGRGWDGLLFALLGGIPLQIIALCAPSLFGDLLFLVCGFLTLLVVIRSGWFRVSRKKAIGILVGIAVVPVILTVLLYRDSLFDRIWIAVHPESDPQGYGYFSMYLRDLCSEAVWLRLPAASAPANQGILFGDALPAVLIANVGWLPFLLLCAALLGLLLAAVVGCLRQKNQFARLIALNIALILGIQILLSIPSNLGYILFGAACPFIDGSFHTVLDMMLSGILLSVFRQETLPHTANRLSSSAPTQKRIRWENGTLRISILSK